MQIQSFHYTKTKKWSIDCFPEMDSNKTLVLIFAAPLYYENQEPIKELTHFYSSSKIIGCSTAGEISGNTLFDESISVVVVKFDHTEIKVVCEEINENKESHKAGLSIAKQLKSAGLKSIFVLSDGLNVNGSELVKGLNSGSQDNIIITGGLAGDGSNFNKTWVIANDQLSTNKIVAVGFYGDNIHVGHASKGGWDIFGPVRQVTRAVGNTLYELDCKPALQLYKEYLGDKAKDLPSSGLLYPLAIHNEADLDKKLVRTILAVDEEAQSMTFAGDIPTGCYAQLMRANFDRLIDSASEASKDAYSLMNTVKDEQSILSIGISCVGRRLLLGERIEEEIESTLEALPVKTTQVGFYSYGELSPYVQGACELHNQTKTIKKKQPFF